MARPSSATNGVCIFLSLSLSLPPSLSGAYELCYFLKYSGPVCDTYVDATSEAAMWTLILTLLREEAPTSRKALRKPPRRRNLIGSSKTFGKCIGAKTGLGLFEGLLASR